MVNFPTSVTTFQVQPELSNCSESFQLQKKLSNFARFFPTLLGSLQLRSILSNFAWLFPTSAKLSNFRLSNLKLSNFSFFPTALSNYTYPPNTMLFHSGTPIIINDIKNVSKPLWQTIKVSH